MLDGHCAARRNAGQGVEFQLIDLLSESGKSDSAVNVVAESTISYWNARRKRVRDVVFSYPVVATASAQEHLEAVITWVRNGIAGKITVPPCAAGSA